MDSVQSAYRQSILNEASISQVPVSTKHNVDCINMMVVQIKDALSKISLYSSTKRQFLQYLPEHPLLFPTNIFRKSKYLLHTNLQFRLSQLCPVRNSSQHREWMVT